MLLNFFLSIIAGLCIGLIIGRVAIWFGKYESNKVHKEFRYMYKEFRDEDGK